MSEKEFDGEMELVPDPEQAQAEFLDTLERSAVSTPTRLGQFPGIDEGALYEAAMVCIHRGFVGWGKLLLVRVILADGNLAERARTVIKELSEGYTEQRLVEERQRMPHPLKGMICTGLGIASPLDLLPLELILEGIAKAEVAAAPLDLEYAEAFDPAPASALPDLERESADLDVVAAEGSADVERDEGRSDPLSVEFLMSRPPMQEAQEEAQQLDVIRRTPHMVVSTEAPPQPGEGFSVTVYADAYAPLPGEESEPVTMMVSREESDFPVEVWLAPSDHFELLSSPLKTMTIHRDEPTSNEVDFQLRVRDRDELLQLKGLVPEQGLLTAYFAFRNRASGKVRRQLDIKWPEDLRSSNASHPPVEGEGPTPPENPPANTGSGISTVIELTLDTALPDLTVRILDPNNNKQNLVCRVSTPHLPKYREWVEGRWNLDGRSNEVVMDLMEEFTASDAIKSQRVASLRGAGRRFYEAAPAVFKQVFWELIDSGRPFESISIISEEPFIPWELMIPRRVLEGSPEERPPLGVAFSIGRWIANNQVAARQRIRLEGSLVLAPKYAGDRELKHAPEESLIVQRSFEPGKEIQPAEFDQFENEIEQLEATVLHFACHGRAEKFSVQVIELEKDQSLSSNQLLGMSRAELGCRRNKPFVFLNACEIGRLQPALVGVGGFALVFIEHGSSAVVAPLWSVRDEIAHKVAIKFYESIMAEPSMPFARIIQAIRAEAYDPVSPDYGEDSYAAYCFYGDPLATWHRH